MAGLNEATLIGHVGKDPEIRKMANGNPVVNFSLATSESWKDRNSGERKERTEWHRITVFNEGLAGIVEKYVSKGSKLFVRGQIRTRKYEKDGIERYSTEIVLENFKGQIVLLDSKGGGDGDSGDREERSSAPEGRTGGEGRRVDMDDEIPFSPQVL